MKYGSRKYIDMILKASSKWATMQPFGKNLAPGDYGKVDEETGEFEYHGNIYTNSDVLSLFPELAKSSYQPEASEPIKHWIITADQTKQGEFDAGPSINGLSVVDASLKVQFNFKKGSRGAFLAMYRPQSIDLPKNVVLHRLHNMKPLRGMYLVTSVVSCPAYALCLTDRSTEKVKLAFVGSLPVVAAPGLSAGGEIGGSWVSENKTGLYQEACDHTGTYKYRPLYTLRRMHDRLSMFRDGTQVEGDALWVEAGAPWKDLDSDGEEEAEFVDYMDEEEDDEED